MNTVTFLYLIIALIFAALAWLAIWSRKADRMRHAAVALFLLSLPVLAWASLESLSWSRPLWAMWGLHGEIKILGAKMVEGVAIYVYADTGEGEPRAIKLPWSTGTAENLQELFGNPANEGQAMMNYEWSWEQREPLFHDLPPPEAEPPKVRPPEAPHLDI